MLNDSLLTFSHARLHAAAHKGGADNLDDHYARLGAANTFTAQNLHPAGTVAAPSVAVGQVGIGLYRHAATVLGLTAAGTMMVWDGILLETILRQDSKLSWGSDAGGVASPDTNLRRDSANVLKTDDDFVSALDIVARHGSANVVKLGIVGPALEPGFSVGSAADVRVWRHQPDELRTDDRFTADHFDTIQTNTWTITNDVADRVLNANALTLDEVGDAFATLVRDLAAGRLPTVV